jgi:hypothetical protein
MVGQGWPHWNPVSRLLPWWCCHGFRHGGAISVSTLALPWVSPAFPVFLLVCPCGPSLSPHVVFGMSLVPPGSLRLHDTFLVPHVCPQVPCACMVFTHPSQMLHNASGVHDAIMIKPSPTESFQSCPVESSLLNPVKYSVQSTPGLSSQPSPPVPRLVQLCSVQFSPASLVQSTRVQSCSV